MALAALPDGLDIGINPSGAMNALLVGGVLIIVAVVGFLVFMIVKNMRDYSTPVNMWLRSGQTAVFTQDRAKIIRNSVTKRPEAIKLQKAKIIEQYPGTDYYHVSMSGKRMLNAFLVNNKLVFFRIEEWLPSEELFKIGWNQSDLHSVFENTERYAKRYSAKDFWSQHGSLVIGGMVIVASFVLMIIIVQQMGQFTESLNNAGAAIMTAAESLRGASP